MTVAAEIVLRPSKGWSSLGLRELWRYRELAYFLAWRDVKVRYKQTLIGVAWAVLQPVLTMIVFGVVFGWLFRLSADTPIPYAIYVYVALLPWQLFAQALGGSSNSLITNQSLITKVYFSRLAVPVAAVLTGLVDFAIALVVLFAMMLYYRIPLTPAVATLPLFVLLAMASALAVGLWSSGLSVRFRDVRYVIPFLTQLWMFATPVAYSVTRVPPAWRPLYALNPMVGVVDGFRWALLGSHDGIGATTWVSAAAVIGLLITGLLYFRRVERTFADVL